MNVLITGATGFIGARLALRCLETGESVRVLAQVNNASEEEHRDLLERRGAEIVVGSVTDEASVQKAVDGVNVVYHLAAAQHEANVADQHFWDVNVKGTGNVLEASIRAGVTRFVHGSTIGVYGAAMDGELDEETPLQPDNIYGVTKREGESLALSYADRLPLVVIRISETYGPGDRRLLKLFRAIQKGAFFMIGRGDNKHQLIYVDDLVEGLRMAASNPQAVGKIFVLAGREILTTEQMVSTIATALGVQRKKLRAPMWPFLLAATILEAVLRPVGVQPPLHRRRMDFFRKSFFFSRDRTMNVLGFEPATDFGDGAAQTARWYRDHGYL